MKKFTLLLLVLTLLTACTSRSGQRERETKTVVQSLISTDEGVQTEPYIKLIGKVLINAIGRVAVVEIEGKRYIIQTNGGILEITDKLN
jgi:outer membrane biogenesis lipoprotein LolB|tara:strand:+ start:9528 stop:9794 length:267 start_codon:yes stop_codon:yes gene_type:complete